MTDLSPAATAVLTAVTLKKYDVPPEGLPAFAEEIAPLIAAALRAAALELHAKEVEIHGSSPYAPMIEVDDLLAIANELEGT